MPAPSGLVAGVAGADLFFADLGAVAVLVVDALVVLLPVASVVGETTPDAVSPPAGALSLTAGALSPSAGGLAEGVLLPVASVVGEATPNALSLNAVVSQVSLHPLQRTRRGRSSCAVATRQRRAQRGQISISTDSLGLGCEPVGGVGSVIGLFYTRVSWRSGGSGGEVKCAHSPEQDCLLGGQAVGGLLPDA